MLKDFFILLLVVGVLELGIRFGLVLYDFHNAQAKTTEIAADRLAADIRDIMINSGGPIAARTLYPILKSNHEARGLIIAVEPSETTKKSIKQIFNFVPRGIPANWPKGRHHSISVEIKADKFCLRCHSGAKIGDTLGVVMVRSYLSSSLKLWWQEVRLSGILNLVKITIDTILLFFLLRVRMEPLLTLRSTISRLAKAGADLSLRARLRSNDEFGELASDFNLFLDRLTLILNDLNAVLERVAVLNVRLETMQEQMTGGFGKISKKLANAMRQLFAAKSDQPLLSSQWLKTVKSTRDLAMRALEPSPQAPELKDAFDQLFDQLEQAGISAKDLQSGIDKSGKTLAGLTDDVQAFSHFIGEMAILEEKMQAIAETGRDLMDRLISKDGV